MGFRETSSTIQGSLVSGLTVPKKGPWVPMRPKGSREKHFDSYADFSVWDFWRWPKTNPLKLWSLRCFSTSPTFKLRIIFWSQEDSWAYSTSTKTCSNPPPKPKNAERIFTSKNLLESAFFFSTNIFQVVSRWRSPQGLPVRAPFHQTLQIPKNGGMNTYKSWADVRKNLHLYDKLYGYGLCKPTK